MVATAPSCFTHSCEFAYFNPSTTATPPINGHKKNKRGIQNWKGRNVLPEEKHLERGEK